VTKEDLISWYLPDRRLFTVKWIQRSCCYYPLFTLECYKFSIYVKSKKEISDRQKEEYEKRSRIAITE